MNTNTSLNTNNDEISLKEIILKLQDWWRYLLSKWLVILVVGFVGGGLGLLYTLSKEDTFTASLSFVLEEEERGGLGGNFGGLAALAGINGGGSSGVFQGDNIIELFKSRSMLSKALLSESGDQDSLLVDRYIAFKGLKDAWKGNPRLENFDFLNNNEDFVFRRDSLLGIFVNDISNNYLNITKPNKALSLILVETTSPNESFAKGFTETLVKKVVSFYIETKTKKAMDNLVIVQLQTDSIRNELNSAIFGVASALDSNPNANQGKQILRVPSSKRQVDVQANQAILTELVKNLETSKISLRKVTPLIQIIDEPVLPLKRERVSKMKGVLVGGVMATFLICILLTAKRILRQILD